MPTIIEYSVVLDAMRKGAEGGLKSLYHNSGAFWFLDGVPTISRGWIGPPDGSITQAALPLTRQARQPFQQELAAGFVKFWLENAPGPIWIMPKSHWAYELQFGSREWLPDVLRQTHIDPNLLSPLNNAAAIEFVSDESQRVEMFVQELLTRLVGSDFQVVFADRRTICTIHTRSQLWWTTVDSVVADRLDELLPADEKDSS